MSTTTIHLVIPNWFLLVICAYLITATTIEVLNIYVERRSNQLRSELVELTKQNKQ